MLQLRRITIMLMAGATTCALLGSQAYAWQQSPTHRHGQTHSSTRQPQTYGRHHTRTHRMRQPPTYGMRYTPTYDPFYPQNETYYLAPGYSPPVTNCGMAGATCDR